MRDLGNVTAAEMEWQAVVTILADAWCSLDRFYRQAQPDACDEPPSPTLHQLTDRILDDAQAIAAGAEAIRRHIASVYFLMPDRLSTWEEAIATPSDEAMN